MTASDDQNFFPRDHVGEVILCRRSPFLILRRHDVNDSTGYGTTTGLRYLAREGRWVRDTVLTRDLRLADSASADRVIVAGQSLSTEHSDESVERLRPGSLVVRMELDAVCAVSEGEEPDGVVVTARRGRCQVAWLKDLR